MPMTKEQAEAAAAMIMAAEMQKAAARRRRQAKKAGRQQLAAFAVAGLIFGISLGLIFDAAAQWGAGGAGLGLAAGWCFRKVRGARETQDF